MDSPSAGGSGGDAPADTFESVDWERMDRSGPPLRWRTRAFLAGLALVGAGFTYEHVAGGSLPLVANVAPLDWLFAASLLALGTFVVVPLAETPAETRRYWRRLRRHPTGVPSLVVVLLFFLVGLLAPVVVSEPTTVVFERSYQPPVGTTVDTVHLYTPDACVGRIAAGKCHGTLRHPLGTTGNGYDLLPIVVLGTRTSLLVAVVSATLLVPTGVGAGLLAAYAGGRVDRVLMQVAQVSGTLPAFIIYVLFWGWSAEHRLLVMVLVFGLTSWGGLARLVRNEALQLRDRPYVKAARAAGAGRLAVLRWHLLPNISRSVVTNVTLQVPLLIVTEAAISYIVVDSPVSGFGPPKPLTLGDPTVVSWGQTISLGTTEAGLAPGWWVAVVPSVLLVATVLAFALLGRTLSDVLDPQPTA